MSETVVLGGASFRMRLDGREGAPWLIFSNSLLTDLSMWDEQVSVLADHFRILRYDQRGHGGTAVPEVPCSFAGLADDVVALMNHLEIDRAGFVGLSMGAATGLALARRHASRLTRMMLCDSPAAAPEGAPALWQSRINLAVQEGMNVLVERTLERWFLPETLTAMPPSINKLRAVMQDTPLAGFAACASALMEFDFLKLLPEIKTPVVYVVGAADGALPDTMREMARNTPGSTLQIIDRAGHLPNIERPEAFAATLNEVF